MVTAETAIALPALLVVLAAALAVVSTLAAQLRCVDAAGEAVRAAARGQPLAEVSQLARRALAGARVSEVRSGHLLTVTVSAPVPSLPGFTASLRVTASATAYEGDLGSVPQ